MDVSRLSKGMVIKNYRELCELLNIKYESGGNAKKSQLKELDRYFKYTKDKSKFIIEEVYTKPIPKNNNMTQYIPVIESLVLHHIVEYGDNSNSLYINKGKLYRELGMINDKYTYYKYKQLQLSHNLKIDKNTIVDFYKSSDLLLKTNVEKALNSLVNQSLIHWTDTFTIMEIDKSTINTNEHILVEKHKDKHGDEYDKVYTKSDELIIKHREATVDEVDNILRIQRMIMLDMNYFQLSDIVKDGRINEFYDTVTEQLKLLYGYVGYYKSYKLVFNMKHIEDRYNHDLTIFRLDSDMRNDLVNMLNSGVSDNMSNNSKNRSDRANNGKGKFNMIDTRSNGEYVVNSNKLIDWLVRLIK